MPISHIVTVVLRLFAIQTFVSAFGLALQTTASVRSYGSSYYVAYFTPGALLVFALLEWFLAPSVSRLVTRRQDSTLNIGGLSREDIYSFAFVFLGLYFVLNSVASSLNWLHYFLSVASGSTAEMQRSFYELASALIPLIAGLIALLQANRWARKLVNRERRPGAA